MVYRSVQSDGRFSLGGRWLRAVDDDGQALPPGVPYVISLPREEWSLAENPGAVVTRSPGDAWERLQARIEKDRLEREAAASAVGSHTSGARLRSRRYPHLELWVHRTSRPDAQGRYQITTFTLHEGEWVPFGHRYAAHGATLREAVLDAMHNYGVMEMVESNPPQGDERLRALERMANTGDAQAAEAWLRILLRIGAVDENNVFAWAAQPVVARRNGPALAARWIALWNAGVRRSPAEVSQRLVGQDVGLFYFEPSSAYVAMSYDDKGKPLLLDFDEDRTLSFKNPLIAKFVQKHYNTTTDRWASQDCYYVDEEGEVDEERNLGMELDLDLVLELHQLLGWPIGRAPQ